MACFISTTRSRSRFASGSFIPLIVRQISTEALGDMRSWRPEHFTVRSGSKPVMEYPRSGTAFSPEASGSPSPQAKNPLRNREGKIHFQLNERVYENHPGHYFQVVGIENRKRSGPGDVIVSENSELFSYATQKPCARPPCF